MVSGSALFSARLSGAPFNLQLSQDINGDSFFNDRPTFASSASNPATVDITKYGNFDISPTPPAGTQLIPINYGNGPVQFAMNMRVAKSFGVGPRVEEGKGAVAGGGGDGGHGGHGMPGMGLGRNRRWPTRPEYAGRPALQHYVERVCPQYLQRGESCAAKWDAGRASGWDYGFAIFWQVKPVGERVLFARVMRCGISNFQALFNF